MSENIPPKCRSENDPAPAEAPRNMSPVVQSHASLRVQLRRKCTIFKTLIYDQLWLAIYTQANSNPHAQALRSIKTETQEKKLERGRETNNVLFWVGAIVLWAVVADSEEKVPPAGHAATMKIKLLRLTIPPERLDGG